MVMTLDCKPIGNMKFDCKPISGRITKPKSKPKSIAYTNFLKQCIKVDKRTKVDCNKEWKVNKPELEIAFSPRGYEKPYQMGETERLMKVRKQVGKLAKDIRLDKFGRELKIIEETKIPKFPNIFKELFQY